MSSQVHHAMSSQVHEVDGDRSRQPRRRASQVAAVERRAARAVTTDVSKRLSGWNNEIARLRGLVEYSASRGLDPRIDNQIEALAAEIQEHRTAFLETVAALPPNVAGSSWIADIDRVLCRVTEVIEALRTTSGARLQ